MTRLFSDVINNLLAFEKWTQKKLNVTTPGVIVATRLYGRVLSEFVYYLLSKWISSE
jgi:hypothetical protein